MIKPTIGRVVLFYPRDITATSQPFSAHVAFVHSDRMINIGFIDSNGVAGNKTSVALVQPEDPIVPDSGPYCTWMPFQIAQAAKPENATGE